MSERLKREAGKAVDDPKGQLRFDGVAESRDLSRHRIIIPLKWRGGDRETVREHSFTIFCYYKGNRPIIFLIPEEFLDRSKFSMHPNNLQILCTERCDNQGRFALGDEAIKLLGSPKIKLFGRHNYIILENAEESHSPRPFCFPPRKILDMLLKSEPERIVSDRLLKELFRIVRQEAARVLEESSKNG